ncbi:hypothetical protein THASP1DRAFT_29506 [Thamnocephalis sphaerospora]|uniref:Protein kinase domain-containing protein n=1 Tax=Thamnocephalis sphaerospora TaxID=78915 RepID=A0A4P9XRI6_9FUNG|nr:hypothetical protein THASP1DRAFT_29506 [Thamnocephalis sphaerospora]|eukprot:RKP08695.1 hypothetical protein THASP1DRAFT_29506 [Thamnocephalis sphaerospora]
MRFALAGALFAITTAALWHNSHASPQRLVARADDAPRAPKWLDIPDLTIKKELPLAYWYNYTARVVYQGRDGLIACTQRVESFNREISAIETIQAGDPKKYGMSPIVKHMFAKPVTKKIGGYFCTLSTWPRSVSLKEYMQQMNPKQKDKALPAIITQVVAALRYLESVSLVHENINTENIMVRQDLASSIPEIIITSSYSLWGIPMSNDFSLFWVVTTESRRERFLCDYGYQPPEDYSKLRKVDMRQRSSWMLGATIYDALTGMPPYGFDSVVSGAVPWPLETFENVLADVATTGNNTFPPVETSHNQPLLKLMETLLDANAITRPTVSKLNATLLEELAKSGDTQPPNLSNPVSIWSLLKLAATTVNPFARSEPK